MNRLACATICSVLLNVPCLARAADGAWRAITPPERSGQATVYDPVRNRMLMIGGTSTSGGDAVYYEDVWELTLDGTPMWTLLDPDGADPPQPGLGRCAIYDPVGDRVIVYGGPFGSYGTWELRLSPDLEWSQFDFGGGDEPDERTNPTAVYDSAEERMIIMGGAGCLAMLCADTWALSLAGVPEWTQLAVGTPLLRSGHSMIYDQNDDRVILYGGDNGPITDDVWELQLDGVSNWTELLPSGTSPGGRYEHAAIYDPVRDRMIVYGGDSDACDPGPGPIGGAPGIRSLVDCTHLWELDLSGPSVEWTELTPGGSHPGWRAGASAIYDAPRDRMILYSGHGFLDLDYREIAALYLSNPETWGDLSPRARLDATVIYDEGADALVGFGGASDGAVRNDLWALKGNDASHGWTQLSPTGPAPLARKDAAGTYDALRHRLLILGGTNGTSDLGDVWSVNLDSPTLAWTTIIPGGSPPAPRSSHTAVYDPTRDRVVVFAGRGGTISLNDVWTLTLAATPPYWTLLSTGGPPPPPRYDHAAVYDPTRDALIVFGGTNGANHFNDVWGLFFSSQVPTWGMAPTTGTPPSARYGHGMIRDPVRDRLVILGGGTATAVFGDAWALSLAGTQPSWEPLTPSGPAPGPRYGHAMVYDVQSDRALIFGGADPTGAYSDVVAIDWSPVTAVPDRTPDGRARSIRIASNPAASSTSLIIEPERTEQVRLAIYDVQGKLVRQLLDARLPAGRHIIEWDGRDQRGEHVPSGVYFGRAMIGSEVLGGKITFVR